MNKISDGRCIREVFLPDTPVGFGAIGHKRLPLGGREVQFSSAHFQLPTKRIRVLATGHDVSTAELGRLVRRGVVVGWARRRARCRIVCRSARGSVRACICRHVCDLLHHWCVHEVVGNLRTRIVWMHLAGHRKQAADFCFAPMGRGSILGGARWARTSRGKMITPLVPASVHHHHGQLRSFPVAAALAAGWQVDGFELRDRARVRQAAHHQPAGPDGEFAPRKCSVLPVAGRHLPPSHNFPGYCQPTRSSQSTWESW